MPNGMIFFGTETVGCHFSDSGERCRQGEGGVRAIRGGRTEEGPRPGEPPEKRDRGQWRAREAKRALLTLGLKKSESAL